MRLIKKLSMLLAFSAPLALGCNNNPASSQQPAPSAVSPQPAALIPTPPAPTPPPPSSTPGHMVVGLIQNFSVPSTGGNMIITGTNIPENPIVTFTGPGEGGPIPASFVTRDQNNPAQLIVGSPNIQALGRPIGLYDITITNSATGDVATGPNLRAQIYASSFSWGMSNAPNASNANHLGSGVNADPVTLQAGDLTGDGMADFIVANRADQSVSSVLRGPGVNANYSVLNLGVGIHVNRPRSLALADFNSDGKLDILVADESSSTASRLVSQSASGGWSASQNQPLVRVSSQSALGVADFNLDGHPDVASVGTGGLDNLTVLFGTGDLNGTFTSKGYNPHPGSYALVPGKFTGDSTRPSLALINDTDLRIVANEADPVDMKAHFVGGDIVSIDGSSSSREVAAGDVNGDGWTDVFVTKATGQNEIEVVLSNASSGIWTGKDAIPAYAHVNHPGALTTGDFNGDGLMDLAVITAHDTLTVYPGKPSPINNIPASVGADTNMNPNLNRSAKFDINKGQTFTVCDQPTSLITCDVNGDGVKDIVIACKQEDHLQILTNTSS